MDATLTVAMHDFEKIRRDLGLPPGVAILESLEALPAREQAAKRKALAAMEWEIAERSLPAPGASELLEGLAALGCPLAILTRNRRDIALHTLQATGLMSFFSSELVLGRDCAAPKPDPAGIHTIVERWDLRPAKVAMVGDYLFDLQAGRAADCYTVHIAPSPKSEWEAYFDRYFPDLRSLTRSLGVSENTPLSPEA